MVIIRFNFYFKEAKKLAEINDILDNSLQIINIGNVESKIDKNKDGVYFYSQSRKGDFFLCILDKNEKIDFIFKIETNIESFCKFILYENCFKEKINFDEIQYSIFTPSENKNYINIFTLNSSPNLKNYLSNDIIMKKSIFDFEKNGKDYVFIKI